MKNKLYIWGITLIFLAICANGCRQAEAEIEKEKPSVRPVRAIQLENSSSKAVRKFPGRAKAVKEVNLAFRVGGPLVKLSGDTGTKVTKGEVVARIDPRDFRVKVRTLKAKLAASKAQLNEATLKHKRYLNLIRKNAAAKAVFDQVKASYEMAAAQVEADKRNLEAAENALKDTVLKAPFTGFIHKKMAENHETVAQGQPVISLVDLSAVEVEVGIPEDLLSRVPDFTGFSCRFDAYPEQGVKAVFKEVGKKANASNSTYPLTLTLQPENSETRILPGMAAEVSISITGRKDTRIFKVPAEALINDAQRRTCLWVFQPEKGEAEKREVQTKGFSDGLMTVTGGLAPGEWVITAGANRLQKGQKVRILQPASETNIGKLL